jgi:hypothetical protein
MSRELLQQALDKFEHLWEIGIDAHYRVDLTPDIRALREELAKPEQEPKLTEAGADTNITRGLEPKGSGMVTLNQVGMRVDLNDAPPRKEWVGLTQEDRDELLNYSTNVPSRLIDWTEEKLKEKNEH